MLTPWRKEWDATGSVLEWSNLELWNIVLCEDSIALVLVKRKNKIE
jgi:hypothetical protein